MLLHLAVMNGKLTYLDISWSSMALSHCYWHLVVKNGNFPLLLTSTQELAISHCYDIWWSRMAISYYTSRWSRMSISHCYFTTSSQEWQFDISTDISSRMAISHCYCHCSSNGEISHCYWHLVVKNGNFPLLLTSRWSRIAISHCYRHLVVKLPFLCSNVKLPFLMPRFWNCHSSPVDVSRYVKVQCVNNSASNDI